MSAAVYDVRECFRRIPAKVRRSTFFGSTKKYLGARHEVRSPLIGDLDFTTQLANWFGVGEHFQGVQRLGSRLVLSGGINRGAVGSVLVIIEMGSRCGACGPWALPSYAGEGHSYRNPWPNDRSVEVVRVSEERWHAGGIQAADGVVAIPVYQPKSNWSEVHFFDLNGPAPLRLEPLVQGGIEAKAVGMARKAGHYLLVVWDDERLDFFVSRNGSIAGGFEWRFRFLKEDPDLPKEGPDTLPNGFSGRRDDLLPGGTYQSLNLVVDTMDDSLYMVATFNSQKASPYLAGADLADLYEVHWKPPFESKPRLSLVERKQMYCYDQQCNFGAAAGIYTEAGRHLWLYAAAHWLHDGNERFNFNEYSYLNEHS